MRVASIYGPLGVGVDYQRYVPASKLDQATPPLLDPAAPHNIGDWFVTKIVDRLLDFEELVLMPAKPSAADFDYVNETCDVLVLKGGNYIQRDWLTKQFGIAFFRQIKIPIVIFGAGLQDRPEGGLEFEPEEIEILRYIHESSACSSIRGERTAEALAAIGIENTAVTGCPTLFWSREPRLVLREPHTGSAGFTFRRFLYSQEVDIHRAQFDAIQYARERFGDVAVILQGEEVLLQHYVEATQWGAEYGASFGAVEGTTLRTLRRSPLDVEAMRKEITATLAPLASPELLDWFLGKLFFSYDIAEYLALYRKQGLVLGCRLHSNLLALASGTPAYYLTYDERTQEIVELLAIPHSRLSDFGDDVDVVGADWKPFEQRYAECYAEMVRFLDANGLSHKLRPAAVPV